MFLKLSFGAYFHEDNVYVWMINIEIQLLIIYIYIYVYIILIIHRFCQLVSQQIGGMISHHFQQWHGLRQSAGSTDCWCFSVWMFPKIVVLPIKSSNLIGFSIINHPFWGTPVFGNTHLSSTLFHLSPWNVGIQQKSDKKKIRAFSEPPQKIHRIVWQVWLSSSQGS